MTTIRLKSALWVAAYLRRCHVEGSAAVVRRRGAEEAGAVFVRICRLDGTSELFGPAPQSVLEARQAEDGLGAAGVRIHGGAPDSRASQRLAGADRGASAAH